MYMGIPDSNQVFEESILNRVTVNFLANAGQTVFAVNYYPNFLEVYRNGIRLVEDTDFIATDGVSVTLTDPCVAGDNIDLVSNAIMKVTDGYTTAQIDSLVRNANAKNALNNNDLIGVQDSVNGFGLKNISFENLKANISCGFKNYIINGNFDIWQRDTSQTSSGYGSDDRWTNTNSGSTKVHSQVACSDTERALFNANFFSRTIVTSVVGTGNYVCKEQRIEDLYKLAGKTVTLSFWAKADSSKNLSIDIWKYYGSGGSESESLVNLQKIALTSTWTKFELTFQLSSNVNKTLTSGNFAGVRFFFDHSVALIDQQSGTFDIAQVQLEEGSVATSFEMRPYGLELSLCQRYYMPFRYVGGAQSYASSIDFTFPLFTTMRATPTLTSVASGSGSGPMRSTYGSSVATTYITANSATAYQNGSVRISVSGNVEGGVAAINIIGTASAEL